MQISQEAAKAVWYSHLFKSFPQFVVIHIVKGFGIVNKAEVDVFWNSDGKSKQWYFRNQWTKMDWDGWI